MIERKRVVPPGGSDAAGKRKGALPAVLFSRTGLVILFLIVQAAITAACWIGFGELLAKSVLGGRTLLVLVVLVCLLNDGRDPCFQLSWCLLFVAAPFFGVLLYLWTRAAPGNRAVRRRLRELGSRNAPDCPINDGALDALRSLRPDSASLARYLREVGRFPLYDGTEVRYFSLGDELFPVMLEQLRQAKRFIFLEYFSIREGEMWGRILEILGEKAREGVDVRVLYDGSCELGALPRRYPELLREKGVRARVWLPLKPLISSVYNYRDHRKIMVIDGQVAFTGGVNLGDEYINRVSRFGRWKDSAIMLNGRAVRSFSSLFLQMWNSGEETPEDFTPFLSAEASPAHAAAGWVIPYADSPLDERRIGKTVYAHILNTAERYVYIMTPYLVLDSDTETALKFAAERGVDVRILLPGIPDKPPVWYLAKRYYRSLLSSGVRIWEYTPGFLHAKSFVSDDTKAVVGSVNLDYRSFYHHFECAVFLSDVPCTIELKRDFLSALGQSREVTEAELSREKLSRRLIGAVMKLIAPLL